MRICLFMLAPLTQGGGAEKYFIDLARNLAAKGEEVTVITLNYPSFAIFARILHIIFKRNFWKKIDISGRETDSWVKTSLGKALWKQVSWKDLKNFLVKNKTIYTKNEIVDLLALKIIGYHRLPSIIVGVHTPLNYPQTVTFGAKFHNWLYASRFYRWLLTGTTGIHVANKFSRDFLRKHFNLDAELIYYPVVPPPIFSPVKQRHFKQIIFIGRLSEQKGVDILIKTVDFLAKIKDLNKKIRINILGSGEEKFVREICEREKKYPWIKFWGHISHQKIFSLLAEQDLLFFPSRWEVCPNVILEAFSVGVPVLAKDIPGPSDLIEPELNGVLVKANKEFSLCLQKFLAGQLKFDKKLVAKSVKKFSGAEIYPKMRQLFYEKT